MDNRLPIKKWIQPEYIPHTSQMHLQNPDILLLPTTGSNIDCNGSHSNNGESWCPKTPDYSEDAKYHFIYETGFGYVNFKQHSLLQDTEGISECPVIHPEFSVACKILSQITGFNLSGRPMTRVIGDQSQIKSGCAGLCNCNQP